MRTNQTQVDAVSADMNSLLSGLSSVGDLRAATPMMEDAQELFDTVLLEVATDRLTIVEDVLADNLVFNLPDPFEVAELRWERISRAGNVVRGMDPDTSPAEHSKQDRNAITAPIFFIWENFQFSRRELGISRRSGSSIDTSRIAQAIRNVNEGVEDQAVNGLEGITFDGHDAPGLLDAPNATPVIYEGGESWTAVGHTGEVILRDVLALIAAAEANNHYGPYTLWIPTLYDNKLNEDYKAAVTGSIRKRLEETEGLTIRAADRLPVDRTVLAEMSTSVLRMIDGMRPQVINWESLNGMKNHWMVLASMVFQTRDDYEGQSGIVLGFTS